MELPILEPILKRENGLGVAAHRRTSADYGAGDLCELIQEVTSQTQGRSFSVHVLHGDLLSE
jgi:hypothetical protein